MLTLNNISCKKGGRVLFKNLSFTIGDCCLLILRGGNGSGKTSILNIMAGLAKPYEGEILYANENIYGEHFNEYCDIVHYVGHKNPLKLQLTVFENLKFWADMRGCIESLEAAIAFFELGDKRDMQVGRLSAGWQKRVALAKILLSNADIWLLDEPFVNLDERGRTLLEGLINSRIGQGGSVVIAAHEKLPFDNAVEIKLEEWH